MSQTQSDAKLKLYLLRVITSTQVSRQSSL